MKIVTILAKMGTQKRLHLESTCRRNAKTLLLTYLGSQFHFEFAPFSVARRHDRKILRSPIRV